MDRMKVKVKPLASILLLLAIVAEVAGTTGLKATAVGFTVAYCSVPQRR